MRRLVVASGLAVAACAPRPPPPPPTRASPPPAAPTAAVLPTPPPGLRLPAGVAPTGYLLTLAVDPARPSFTGEVAIELAVAAPTDVVWLHAAELTIDDATVEVDGVAAPAIIVPDRAHQRVGLWLARPLPVGSARARLRYRGAVVDDEPTALFRQRDGVGAYLYTQMEGVFARQVVPCFDEPSAKVPWRVTVRAPAGLGVYANTPEVGRRAVGGEVEVEFAPTPPMPSYLLAIAVGPFEEVDVGPVGRAHVPTRIVVPAGQAPTAAAAAAVTPALVDALEAYFDRPLPLAKLDLVVVPRFFGAMENPGLITFAASVLLEDPRRPSAAGLRELRATVAHELAHQWFGDLVTPRWWDDLWLNESFATWMAAATVRALDPRDDGVTAERDAMERAMAADGLPSARPLRRPIAGGLDVDDSFDAIAYEKGGALLAMFERSLGQRGFRDGVRAYLAAHAGGNASAADFLAALAAAAQPEVAAAFASFLDHPGVPEVALALECGAAGAAAVATVTSDRGAAPWALPICVRFPDQGGPWGERCVWLPPGGGRIALPRCPSWLAGNPDGVGYYRVSYDAALDAALRAHLAEVPSRDRFARAADLAAHVRAGRAAPAAILPWLDALLATGARPDAVAAVDLATALGAHVAPADRPRWQRFVRGRFRAAARRVGLRSRAGDTTATRAARDHLVRLVAIDGADPALRAAAVAAVDAWLTGGGDPGDDRDRLLAIAAAAAPFGLRDRLVGAALATDDRELRGELLAALGALTHPADRAANLALYLGAPLDPVTALPLVTGGLGTDVDAEAWAELTRAYPAVVARLNPLDRAELVAAAADRCSATAAAEVAGFFGPYAAADPHLALELPPALEAIARCAAERDRLRPAIAAVLPP
ncbi:MAG: ERAP1-like C-terminal domain-containing protein [Myxococcales bacterium]|nr:ERAP1-like C-terminal domain-containing protein [Myxococcales bacterium]